jgi:hypothetical protein
MRKPWKTRLHSGCRSRYDRQQQHDEEIRQPEGKKSTAAYDAYVHTPNTTLNTMMKTLQKLRTLELHIKFAHKRLY